MATIGIFFAEGFEECEALLIVDLCRRAGIEVRMISITDSLQVTSSHKVTVVTDELISNTDFEALDMIVLPGGMPGTTNLSENEILINQVKKFHEQHKQLAAICAAPTIFAKEGLLTNLKATCYPSFSNGSYENQFSSNGVEVEPYIITGQALGSCIDFSLAIIERLLGAEKKKEIMDAIVYK